MREIIGEYQRVCTAVIESSHGYVAKYMGDGVLAYFGYPQAREDAADCAMHAGLGIVQMIMNPDGVPTSAPKSTHAVRIGIATGEVVVGEQIGVDSSREWSVVSDTPNLAARLQAAAKPGQVIVSDQTRRLVRQKFSWSGPRLLSLKGFGKPVQVWEVNTDSGAAEPLASFAPADSSRLIGRQSELALLGDRLELANSGHGQVVVLVGEAGIGKSAIARALIERARNEQIACIQFSCSQFHQSSELKPFAVQIERDAGIVRKDPPADNLNRIRAWLARNGHDTEANAGLFAALLLLPASENYRLSDLTPRALRAMTLDSLETHIIALERQGPVMLVIEDVHWMDPTSAELLNRLVNRVGGRRIIIFVNARPEFEAGWTRLPHVTLLTLNRLGHRDAKVLIREVTGGARFTT